MRRAAGRWSAARPVLPRPPQRATTSRTCRPGRVVTVTSLPRLVWRTCAPCAVAVEPDGGRAHAARQGVPDRQPSKRRRAGVDLGHVALALAPGLDAAQRAVAEADVLARRPTAGGAAPAARPRAARGRGPGARRAAGGRPARSSRTGSTPARPSSDSACSARRSRRAGRPRRSPATGRSPATRRAARRACRACGGSRRRRCRARRTSARPRRRCSGSAGRARAGRSCPRRPPGSRCSARRSCARPCPRARRRSPCGTGRGCTGARPSSTGPRAPRAPRRRAPAPPAPATPARRRVSSASIGVWPIQCFWKDCTSSGIDQRVGVLARGRVPPGGLEALPRGPRRVARPRVRAVVAGGARQVRQVVEPADRVDGVVELLVAHARALDVAQALGPAVAVGVELRR